MIVDAFVEYASQFTFLHCPVQGLIQKTPVHELIMCKLLF